MNPEFPKKLLLIGLDAPIVKSIKRCMSEGFMPNLARLVENGVWCENCLVPYPTITPPNWTTIVTGAWPGTHGITSFNNPYPDGRLHESYEALYSGDCKAEYIWEVAGRLGWRSIILNYPSTWPPRGKNIIQIYGGGLAPNEWRITPEGELMKGGYRVLLSFDQLFTDSDEYPQASKVVFKPADDWKNLDEEATYCEITFGQVYNLKPVKPVTYYVLRHSPSDISICREKDLSTAICRLKKGEWSPKLSEKFYVEGYGYVSGFFKFRFLPDEATGFRFSWDLHFERVEEGAREEFKLYLTPIGAYLDGIPEHLREEMEKNLKSLPIPGCVTYHRVRMGWFSGDHYVQMASMSTEWLTEAGCFLMDKYSDWRLFIMHEHTPDHMYHLFMNLLEPQVNKDDVLRNYWIDVERRLYNKLDEMIGRLVEKAGEETLVVITSDHGALPTETAFHEKYRILEINHILEAAGFIQYKEEDGQKVVDWSRTKAFCQRTMHVYINLKGRQPYGIVSPSEYESVRDEVMYALLDYVDPLSGKRPVYMVIKKEDARPLGLYGDKVGDLIPVLRPEASGEHGRHFPTAEWGVGSMKGLLVLSGPGIKKGVTLERTVWLTDIVPTVCYLLHIPVPRNVEGGIIYQALENPDLQLNEIAHYRRLYERAQSALDSLRSLSHEY